MRFLSVLALILALSVPASAQNAPGKIKVLTTFSILYDMAGNVGKDKIDLQTIVGFDQDMHGYELTPDDFAKAANADVIIANGLGFEPWLDQLIKNSGFKGELVLAANLSSTIPLSDDEKRARDEWKRAQEEKAPQSEADAKAPKKKSNFTERATRDDFNPHAWGKLMNARLYVINIAKGMSKADPANEAFYTQNSADYRKSIQNMEEWAATTFRKIPAERRKMVTMHDSLAYLAKMYDIRAYSVEGFNSAFEVSAQQVRTLIDLIKRENIRALFFENTVNNNVLEQIAQETGVKPGGILYTDALSNANKGVTDSYTGMMRYNIETIAKAMTESTF